jgi:methylenetetrahydrofolate reductase (NADPH)
MKVDAGAEYIVTQMFYDNERFFRFVKECKEAGIDVPIIPGLKPITTLRQSTLLPKTFHIDLPSELTQELEKCKDNAAACEVGIEWCVKQSKELMKAGVPCLHYYTMSNSAPIRRIAELVF